MDATRALKRLDERDLSDLALLTLSPTLQGRRNVVIGNKAISGIMDSIRLVIEPWITLDTGAILHFQTPSRVAYELRVASDPDISLDILLPTAIGTPQRQPIAALEVKGGKDISNAHDRTGEAEKSHLKAAAAGYSHRWTIMELAGLSLARIRSETPSSTAIFDTAQIIARTGPSWDAFRANLTALLGA